jgi:hypothetical protein
MLPRLRHYGPAPRWSWALHGLLPALPKQNIASSLQNPPICATDHSCRLLGIGGGLPTESHKIQCDKDCVNPSSARPCRTSISRGYTNELAQKQNPPWEGGSALDLLGRKLDLAVEILPDLIGLRKRKIFLPRTSCAWSGPPPDAGCFATQGETCPDRRSIKGLKTAYR